MMDLLTQVVCLNFKELVTNTEQTLHSYTLGGTPTVLIGVGLNEREEVTTRDTKKYSYRGIDSY